MVAGEHARIVPKGEGYEISPCSWYGKLHVNGKQVKDSVALVDGDTIQIGSAALAFRTSMFEDE